MSKANRNFTDWVTGDTITAVKLNDMKNETALLDTANTFTAVNTFENDTDFKDDVVLKSGAELLVGSTVVINASGNIDADRVASGTLNADRIPTLAAAKISGTAVTLSGSQTITGTKTFNGAVSVPTPTLAAHAVTKDYVDSGLGAVSWSSLTGKPLVFPPDTHTHLWADITDKPSTFAPASHSHAWGDITGKPSTFPPANHSTTRITSGVLSHARGGLDHTRTGSTPEVGQLVYGLHRDSAGGTVTNYGSTRTFTSSSKLILSESNVTSITSGTYRCLGKSLSGESDGWFAMRATLWVRTA